MIPALEMPQLVQVVWLVYAALVSRHQALLLMYHHFWFQKKSII